MESKEPLPETVQWLLDFANLGCIPGEPNPQRFKSYHTYTFKEYITNEHIPKLNRPPIELLSPEKKKSKNTPCENTISMMPLHEIIKKFKDIKSTNHILYDGYEISISKTGEAVFHGKNIELFPLIVDFCSKKGISLKKNCKHVFSHKKCNYSMAMTYWHIAQSFFNRVMQVNSGEGVHPFVKMAFDYAKENKPAHKLSQWVSQCVWDFWNNQRALHPRLKQCPCCGAFWMAKEKRGRGKPQKYCHEDCENEFNQASKRKNSKASRGCKNRKRKKSRRDKETELINHFKSRGQTLQDAEVLAQAAVRNGETIEDYSQNK